MSTAQRTLNAGGLVSAKAKVDKISAEEVVARTYRHPALGDRPVIRLGSSRLGQAEDLAMEFLGFQTPQVSPPVAIQQRRSLGFAAWALVNDPDNARYALDLVKRMKAADRKAKSKPGHAWEMFDALSKELGRSVRHFLPPFWEEVGRTYKDLGNQTYAGRALNKSLEAERVHALESDRLRRRDVILEFVLAGCLAGKALSDYTNDLKSQYPPQEAFEIFRDLCVRRTRGGMAPWANLPKDFLKLAKAADVDADAELEAWLEEVIDTPAMGRAAFQFWKNCDKQCRRIVKRNPAFAVALLRHTRPEERYWGESKLWPWIDLLDDWGTLEFLWEEGHQGAPPLGEPIAVWFGRIVREDLPTPKRVFEMLERLTPRLKQEQTPLPLSTQARYRSRNVDVDFLETCLDLGIAVEALPVGAEIEFNGWLMAVPDHKFRNRDLVLAPKDERFASAVARGLAEALTCKGEALNRGYRVEDFHRRPFPEAAGDREGIQELWHAHAVRVISYLENTGLASFTQALEEVKTTFWPETLRHFPDVAQRLAAIDPNDVLQKTLQSGILDEYGWPELEALTEAAGVEIAIDKYSGSTGSLTFPQVVLWNKTHAFVLNRDGKISKRELRLPAKVELLHMVAVGDDVAVHYRDAHWNRKFYWLSDRAQKYDADYGFLDSTDMRETVLDDGSLFYGKHAVRPGDSKQPQGQATYFHDGERFWGISWADEPDIGRQPRLHEIDPHTGKQGRASVPSWFESSEGDAVEFVHCQLFPAPESAKDSPLGCQQGMLGWKVVRHRDGSLSGEGIDGRRWDKRLPEYMANPPAPAGMLRRIGADGYLPIGHSQGRWRGQYWLYDPEGTTAVAEFGGYRSLYACGQAILLPLEYWHLLKPRDEATSKKLRGISNKDCAELLDAAVTAQAKQSTSSGPSLPNQIMSVVMGLLGSTGDDEEDAGPSKQGLAKIQEHFPQAPDRLALGIAGIVHLMHLRKTEFLELREQLTRDVSSTSDSSGVRNQKVDMAAQMWGLPEVYSYGNETVLGEHLLAAAAFLKGEQDTGPLPSVDVVWFDLLDDLPLLAWQTYWRAQATKHEKNEDRERPWRELLTFWNELEIGSLPGRFDRLVAQKKKAKKKSGGVTESEDSPGASYGLVVGEDRFLVISTGRYGYSDYQILRYSTAKKPATPPGFVMESEHPLRPHDHTEEFEAFFRSIDAAEQLPVPTPDELAQLAGQVGASPAEVGLIWIGGLNIDSYESNFLPAAIRSQLGVKATDAKAARQCLTNLNADVRQRLYHAVVSQGLAAPLAADRTPVLEALRQAWDAHMPKRIPLDAEHQRRLSALAKENRWGQIDHEHVLSAATDPHKHPLLQVHPCEIKLKSSSHYERLALEGKGKTEPVSWSLLRTLAQLVATVHSETPLGHPARASVPPLIQRLVEVIDHEDLMWVLRTERIYGANASKPTAWLNQHLGKTTVGKDRIARFDDGFVVAGAFDSDNTLLIGYRVSKVQSDDEMQRLRGILSIQEDPYGSVEEALPIIALLRSTGFQKLAQAILGDETTEDHWPQNPLHSAPDVVAAVQKKLKLSEDAALLYLQTLALPDPTTANLRKWNGWTAARIKKATTELVAKERVLEAKRARAGRTHFLPGEWLELKTPWLPIETWKIPLLVDLQLDGSSLTPLSGPLVLRPYEDLFQEAWQRVIAGDEPRYEEAGKKVKKSATGKK